MKKRKIVAKKKPLGRAKTLKEKRIEEKQEVKAGITQQDIQGKDDVSMQITPLGDRILVKPLEAEEKTKGGIILPDTAKEKPQEGRVVAVGKGKVLEDGKIQPLEVKPGDKIIYGKYSGTEIKLEDEEHLIIKEEDVLAIIND
ncbi:MAG: 10 kDa chaperonin 5 [Candidatus Omnitrophica bacterium ADurb.Bin205]|nr:MAG: 10 kDa chaperonin 5 [Candidatus Omnitrophica bacterium ADurb.Bin205]